MEKTCFEKASSFNLMEERKRRKTKQTENKQKRDVFTLLVMISSLNLQGRLKRKKEKNDDDNNKCGRTFQTLCPKGVPL